MKTPEEVAQDTLNALDLGGDLTEGAPKTERDLTHAVQSGWIEGDTVLNMIRSAIEADRAQRAEPTPEQIADSFASVGHALDWESGPKRRAYIIQAVRIARGEVALR
jgi:hypothetical protein